MSANISDNDLDWSLPPWLFRAAYGHLFTPERAAAAAADAAAEAAEARALVAMEKAARADWFLAKAMEKAARVAAAAFAAAEMARAARRTALQAAQRAEDAANRIQAAQRAEVKAGLQRIEEAHLRRVQVAATVRREAGGGLHALSSEPTYVRPPHVLPFRPGRMFPAPAEDYLDFYDVNMEYNGEEVANPDDNDVETYPEGAGTLTAAQEERLRRRDAARIRKNLRKRR